MDNLYLFFSIMSTFTITSVPSLILRKQILFIPKQYIKECRSLIPTFGDFVKFAIYFNIIKIIGFTTSQFNFISMNQMYVILICVSIIVEIILTFSFSIVEFNGYDLFFIKIEISFCALLQQQQNWQENEYLNFDHVFQVFNEGLH
jgi:hypothetical protein